MILFGGKVSLARSRANQSIFMRYLSAIIEKIRSLRRRWLDRLEEGDDIRAFDEAIASDDEAIPFGQAIAEIERTRVESRPSRPH